MFSHIMVGSNDLDRSKRFYDAVFEAMGGRAGRRDDVVLSYHHQGSVFMVRTPLDNARATHGNGSTIGFSLATPEQVHSWHDAGVAAGGTAVEDPPGTRSLTFGSYYLAYLRDPDGNKLCALHSLSED